MPVGVRGRLVKGAAIGFAVVFAVCGVLFGPAIVSDIAARNGTFATTKRKLERLRNIALLRSPEQKRLMKALDGQQPKAAPSGPKIISVPRH